MGNWNLESLEASWQQQRSKWRFGALRELSSSANVKPTMGCFSLLYLIACQTLDGLKYSSFTVWLDLTSPQYGVQCFLLALSAICTQTYHLILNDTWNFYFIFVFG